MGKVYAVKKGRKQGIYTSWSDCSKQVDGYPGAEFKSFRDINEAIQYILSGNPNSQKPQHTGFYAVKRGREPGIYHTWNECKEQIEGFEKPVFKKFSTEEDAKEWMKPAEKKSTVSVKPTLEDEPIYQKEAVAYIDGSFNEETGVAGFGIVFLGENGEETSCDTVDALGMRQINGEITAAETAVRYANICDYDHITLYYDYEGVEKWATGAWKTNKERTTEYKEAMKELSKDIAISFKKVLAHSGVEYNEKADELAKNACGMK